MKHVTRYFSGFCALILAMALVLSGCGPATPASDGYSAPSLLELLGSDPASVGKALGVNLETDAQIVTSNGGEGLQIYVLNNYLWIHNANCALVLDFYAGVLGGYQFSFDSAEGDDPHKAGYDFAAEMQQALNAKYGEAVTGPEIPAQLREVTGPDAMLPGAQYIEQWTAKDSAALSEKLFGTASDDDLLITLMLEGNGEGTDKVSRLVLEYTLPGSLEP